MSDEKDGNPEPEGPNLPPKKKSAITPKKGKRYGKKSKTSNR